MLGPLVYLVRITCLFLNIRASFKALGYRPSRGKRKNVTPRRHLFVQEPPSELTANAQKVKKRLVKQQMLIWIVWLILSQVESLLDRTMVYIVPFYEELKLLILVSMIFAGSDGAEFVFKRWLKPYVSRYEKPIDVALSIGGNVGEVGVHAVRFGMENVQVFSASIPQQLYQKLESFKSSVTFKLPGQSSSTTNILNQSQSPPPYSLPSSPIPPSSRPRPVHILSPTSTVPPSLTAPKYPPAPIRFGRQEPQQFDFFSPPPSEPVTQLPGHFSFSWSPPQSSKSTTLVTPQDAGPLRDRNRDPPEASTSAVRLPASAFPETEDKSLHLPGYLASFSPLPQHHSPMNWDSDFVRESTSRENEDITMDLSEFESIAADRPRQKQPSMVNPVGSQGAKNKGKGKAREEAIPAKPSSTVLGRRRKSPVDERELEESQHWAKRARTLVPRDNNLAELTSTTADPNSTGGTTGNTSNSKQGLRSSRLVSKPSIQASLKQDGEVTSRPRKKTLAAVPIDRRSRRTASTTSRRGAATRFTKTRTVSATSKSSPSSISKNPKENVPPRKSPPPSSSLSLAASASSTVRMTRGTKRPRSVPSSSNSGGGEDNSDEEGEQEDDESDSSNTITRPRRKGSSDQPSPPKQRRKIADNNKATVIQVPMPKSKTSASSLSPSNETSSSSTVGDEPVISAPLPRQKPRRAGPQRSQDGIVPSKVKIPKGRNAYPDLPPSTRASSQARGRPGGVKRQERDDEKKETIGPNRRKRVL